MNKIEPVNKKVTLFDMLPWTYHVESVCLLVKR